MIVLPLEFISGIFVPSEQIPDWMNSIASVFPVKPLFDSLLAAFDPADDGDRRRLGRSRGASPPGAWPGRSLALRLLPLGPRAR